MRYRSLVNSEVAKCSLLMSIMDDAITWCTDLPLRFSTCVFTWPPGTLKRTCSVVYSWVLLTDIGPWTKAVHCRGNTVLLPRSSGIYGSFRELCDLVMSSWLFDNVLESFLVWKLPLLWLMYLQTRVRVFQLMYQSIISSKAVARLGHFTRPCRGRLYNLLKNGDWTYTAMSRAETIVELAVARAERDKGVGDLSSLWGECGGLCGTDEPWKLGERIIRGSDKQVAYRRQVG